VALVAVASLRALFEKIGASCARATSLDFRSAGYALDTTSVAGYVFWASGPAVLVVAEGDEPSS
jgi:hypothetical protein